MAETLMQRVVDALPFLDDIAEDVQPKVQEAVDAGGTTARNVLDGAPGPHGCTCGMLDGGARLRWT
jgi:hypothetical protein